jgi:hypothetical protein
MICQVYKNYLESLDLFDIISSSNDSRIIKEKIQMNVDEKITLQHSEDINKLNLSNYPQITVNNPL